jgi:hypothetical protein
MMAEKISAPNVYEIRIKRVAELSEEAKAEVEHKLQNESEEFRGKFGLCG